MAKQKVTAGRNELQYIAAQERRLSGAAGTMADRRTHRNRSRSEQRRNAIREAS